MIIKKYEILKDVEYKIGDKKLYRIRALKTFEVNNGYTVKKGELGGCIQSEKNLSQNGSCWIGEGASVYENAIVSLSALVYGKARVYGEAKVYGNCEIYECAQVYGSAIIFGDSKIYGYAKIFGNAEVNSGFNFSGRDEISGKDDMPMHPAVKSFMENFDKI